MTNGKKIAASDLAKRFLMEKYIDLEGNRMLHYFNKRFFAWSKGQYAELDHENIKLEFTQWVSDSKISKLKFSNTKNNADEALHHIRTQTLLKTKSNLIINRYISDEERTEHIAFQNGIPIYLEHIRHSFHSSAS